MKAKIVAISSLIFVLAFTAGCGLLPGSGNSSTPPSTPVGPINSNYSNAISPAQQLILGTMNLQGNLEVTPDEAAQLYPLWEAYQTLSTSNTASPLELQATLVGVEQAMTPDQVQAIVNMKLTRQDMAIILQQQGVSFGGRGGSGTPRAGAAVVVDSVAAAVEFPASLAVVEEAVGSAVVDLAADQRPTLK